MSMTFNLKSKKYKILCSLFSAFAFLFFVLAMCQLANRNDAESFQLVAHEPNNADDAKESSAQSNSDDADEPPFDAEATFEIRESSHISVMMCLPENRKDELPSSFVASCQTFAPDGVRSDAQNCRIETLFNDDKSFAYDESFSKARIAVYKPRPLAIPAKFAASNAIDQRQFCATDTIPSTITYLNKNTEQNSINHQCDEKKCEAHSTISLSIAAPRGALVAAAISHKRDSQLAFLTWLLFTISLYTAIAMGIRCKMKTTTSQDDDSEAPPTPLDDKPRCVPSSDAPIYGRLDGLLAFLLAMLVSYAIALFTHSAFPRESSLFPGFHTTLALMFANFFAFISAFALVRLFRFFFPLRRKTAHPPRVAPRPCNDATPKDAHAAADQIPQSENEILQKNDNTEPSPKSEKKQKKKSKLHSFYDRLRNAAQRHPMKFALYAGVLLACLAFVVSVVCPLPGLTTIELSSRLTSSAFVLGFSVLLAAIAEETVFRGIIQTSLSARADSAHPHVQNAVAILLTTLVFVFIHVPQSVDHLWALIAIGLFSLSACWIRLQTGSVLPAIATHMTYNACLALPSLAIVL